MKTNQTPPALKSKSPLPAVLGIFTLILLSGAAYAPVLLNPETAPLPKFEMPAQTAALVQPTVSVPAPKSRLAQRLNARYQTSRSLRASA